MPHAWNTGSYVLVSVSENLSVELHSIDRFVRCIYLRHTPEVVCGYHSATDPSRRLFPALKGEGGRGWWRVG